MNTDDLFSRLEKQLDEHMKNVDKAVGKIDDIDIDDLFRNHIGTNKSKSSESVEQREVFREIYSYKRITFLIAQGFAIVIFMICLFVFLKTAFNKQEESNTNSPTPPSIEQPTTTQKHDQLKKL